MKTLTVIKTKKSEELGKVTVVVHNEEPMMTEVYNRGVNESVFLWDGSVINLKSNYEEGVGSFKIDFSIGTTLYHFTWVNTCGNGFYAMLTETLEDGTENNYHTDRDHRGDITDLNRWQKSQNGETIHQDIDKINEEFDKIWGNTDVDEAENEVTNPPRATDDDDLPF